MRSGDISAGIPSPRIVQIGVSIIIKLAIMIMIMNDSKSTQTLIKTMEGYVEKLNCLKKRYTRWIYVYLNYPVCSFLSCSNILV